MIKWGGVEYRLHPLFLILMLFSVWTGYFAEMLTLFGVVTIHELGHVAAARAYGWRIRRVQLLPFGGVAEMEESANVPAKEEMVVALCGPLQNVWMAVFAAAMLEWGPGQTADYWAYFLQANLMIGLFNLLPVLPLDGGKLVLGAFSYLFSYHRVLSAVLHTSLLLSLCMVIAALARYAAGGVHLNLLAIGLFLFFSNWYSIKHLPYQFFRFLISREASCSRMKQAGQPPHMLVVPYDQEPVQVLRRFKRERHHLLYIVDRAGDVLQICPEDRLLRAYLSRVSGPPGSRGGNGAGRKRGKGEKIG
ncbi:M50 family metallopeptidase [Paenibacillus sp. YN15]|uniref:M50 family metallopeptidase n=1 Tax=Paenibacillus sp. YN15 TaxID=1742774 RepID=UPI00215C09D7|nr:M50 family metallopeptidase [Paenibacillus sp. YN15]